MKYRFLRFPGFRTKALTLSYDDGPVFDKRLIEIIDRYGIKATFNLNGDVMADGFDDGWHVTRKEAVELYRNHEVAVHGQHHMAPMISAPIDAIAEVRDGRQSLERAFGGIIRGYAYPDICKTTDEIKSYLRMLGIKYARVADHDNDSFEIPSDWLEWVPTCHHTNPQLMTYADKFLSAKPLNKYCAQRRSLLFYLWGHSFEFNNNNNWELLERFCEKTAGNPDIWYATNMEIHDYTEAYRSLVFNVDNTLVYNPSNMTVYFDADGKNISVEPFETLSIE